MPEALAACKLGSLQICLYDSNGSLYLTMTTDGKTDIMKLGHASDKLARRNAFVIFHRTVLRMAMAGPVETKCHIEYPRSSERFKNSEQEKKIQQEQNSF